jgi:hypothetical protein
MQLPVRPERVNLSAHEVNLGHFAFPDAKEEVVSALMSGEQASGPSEEQVLGRHLPRKFQL